MEKAKEDWFLKLEKNFDEFIIVGKNNNETYVAINADNAKSASDMFERLIEYPSTTLFAKLAIDNIVEKIK